MIFVSDMVMLFRFSFSLICSTGIYWWPTVCETILKLTEYTSSEKPGIVPTLFELRFWNIDYEEDGSSPKNSHHSLSIH